MFLVGLTGGVATGKSTVAGMFRSLGVPVVDADVLARRIVEPGRPAYKKILAEFGADVVLCPETGELDRAALRRIVFEDEAARRRLDAITHPIICREICWEVAKLALLSGHQYAVLDLPLLFEADASATSSLFRMTSYLHQIVVVTCEEDLQLQRLMEQRGLSERESKLMIAAQMSLEDKSARADFVLENSGSEQDTRKQLLAVHQKLAASWLHWKIRLVLGLAMGGVFGIAIWVAKKATTRR